VVDAYKRSTLHGADASQHVRTVSAAQALAAITAHLKDCQLPDMALLRRRRDWSRSCCMPPTSSMAIGATPIVLAGVVVKLGAQCHPCVAVRCHWCVAVRYVHAVPVRGDLLYIHTRISIHSTSHATGTYFSRFVPHDMQRVTLCRHPRRTACLYMSTRTAHAYHLHPLLHSGPRHRIDGNTSANKQSWAPLQSSSSSDHPSSAV
jgi:hypothetical protein